MDFSGDYLKFKAEELNRPEGFIEEMESYVSHLREAGLPVIFSPKHWALLMGTEYEQLSNVLDRRAEFYDEFYFKKKRGGYRQIHAPQPELHKIQQWIKIFILDKLKFPGYVTSYQKKRSIFTNAAFHVKKEIVIKFDLQNFFEDITQEKVLGIFRMIGYNTAVAVDLARACCIELAPRNYRNQLFYGDFACLPQGSPASPGLSNLAGVKLDLRLSEYAKSKDFAYSRYADDLTFSGEVKNKIRRSVIQAIISEEGFTLNTEKTKYIHRSCRQIVTGITVNEKMALSKKYRRKIHTELHNAVKFGPYNQLKRNGIHRSNYREWLLGHILFIRQLHPREAERMKKKFELINWL